MSDIKIRSLVGGAIKVYIPSILMIREQIFREFPDLMFDNLSTENSSLKEMCRNKEAIAVLIFDGAVVIGASTGMPLKDERISLQKGLRDLGENPANYYYFGLSALLKPYRGRGLAHHFFDIREEHVRHVKKYRKICFTTVARSPSLQQGGLYMEDFWRKRGYVEHKETLCASHHLHFWIKEPVDTPHREKESALHAAY